jgi:pyruvate dehydrogenase E2 component (dihydrolipoamide acetyltransferase)
MRADVLAATAPQQTTPGAVEPVSAIRRVIIERMTEAARTVAPVTLTTDADASELVKIRALIKDELAGCSDPVPSFNDLIARLVALALIEHPDLNATLSGDSIVQHEAVHIGIAVDTERGLLAPVVRDADRKSAFDIARESAVLIAKARAGTAPAETLKGSTFTISNLGMFDIDAFTPIINLPECAILGLGRIQSRAVVIDEEAETVAVRKVMALSLTFDHRVVDGAPAARFLQSVRRKIEKPYTWLMR